MRSIGREPTGMQLEQLALMPHVVTRKSSRDGVASGGISCAHDGGDDESIARANPVRALSLCANAIDPL